MIPTKIEPINFSRHKTKTGLEVITVPLKQLYHSEILLFSFTGPVFETEANNGISHFLEHMLFRGCKKHNNIEALYNYLESISAMMNGFTSRIYTCYHMHILSRYLEDGLSTMSDIFQNPLFLDIETEKKIICEEILEDFNEKGVEINIDNISKKLIFKDRSKLSLPIIGTEKNILSLDKNGIADYYYSEYTKPNLVLCVLGNFKEKDIINQAEDKFSFFKEGVKRRINDNPVENHGPALNFTPHKSSRTDFLFTLLGPGQKEPDYQKFVLFKKIFDGGMNSILYTQICTQRGLAYDVEVNLDSYPNVSLLEIFIPASSENILKIFNILMDIFKNIKASGITGEKIDIMKRNYLFDIEYALDNHTFVTEWLALSSMLELDDDLNKKIEATSKISLAEINSFITSILTSDRLFISIVGSLKKRDEEQIKKALSAF